MATATGLYFSFTLLTILFTSIWRLLFSVPVCQYYAGNHTGYLWRAQSQILKSLLPQKFSLRHHPRYDISDNVLCSQPEALSGCTQN